MSRQAYKPKKLFTVDEANAMLPLVRAIAKDVSELYHDLIERQRRLDLLTGRRDIEVGDPYSDELVEMERELEADQRRLREYVEELQHLGVELKGPADGLLDFPSEMDGRIVYLCWKLGEPEVAHWHELDTGFAGRHSLAVGALDSPDDHAH